MGRKTKSGIVYPPMPFDFCIHNRAIGPVDVSFHGWKRFFERWSRVYKVEPKASTEYFAQQMIRSFASAVFVRLPYDVAIGRLVRNKGVSAYYFHDLRPNEGVVWRYVVSSTGSPRTLITVEQAEEYSSVIV